MKGLRKRHGRAAHAHEVMARRRTADGQLVQVWSDGAITVGHETSNRYAGKKIPRSLLWVIADDVSLYDAREVTALVKAARKALSQHPSGDTATLRVAMRQNVPRLGPPVRTANLTDAQREAILASQKRTQWFDPQTGVLTYAPGYLPSEVARRKR